MQIVRKNMIALLLTAMIMGCAQNEPEIDPANDLTGNEITYALASGSDFNVSGIARFQETKDGFTRISITLDKTFQDGLFPVHLHLGDVATDDAAIAALLAPVPASKAASVTDLVRLSDESKITFADLKALEACIKIHLAAEGEGKDIILAAGNIGSAVGKPISGGRSGIAVCSSN